MLHAIRLKPRMLLFDHIFTNKLQLKIRMMSTKI